MATQIRNPLFDHWQMSQQSLKSIAEACGLSSMHINRMVRYSPKQMSGVSFKNILKIKAGTGIDMSSYAMLGLKSEMPKPDVRARVQR